MPRRRQRIFDDFTDVDVWLIAPGRYENIHASPLTTVEELVAAMRKYNYQPALVLAKDPLDAIAAGAVGDFILSHEALTFIEEKYTKDPRRKNPK